MVEPTSDHHLNSVLLSDSERIQELEGLIDALQKQVATLEQQHLDDSIEIQAVTDEFERADAEVKQALEALERANNVKSAFLANMSHELRTPLNAIINFSKFLKRQIPGPLTAEQDKLIGDIAESGQHLLNLINDVLDMSKIESGSLKLYVEEQINLREIIGSAIRITAPLIAEKPITLQQDIPETLPALTGDRKRLLQIFLNILSNASKFTEKGAIKVRVWEENGALLTSVEDTGPGIAAEDMEHVFTAFKQTDRGLRQGGSGTGLGMPICQRLVEAHHGHVWFESKPESGTTFFVSLPLESKLVAEKRPSP